MLNIKDRHNGNILLDNEGHLVHIDFGFMLSNSPGNMNFEAAPFKLTYEYVDLMGGVDSEIFCYFKSLLIKGFFEMKRHIDEIIVPIEIMYQNSKMPCFRGGQNIFSEIRERFSTKYNVTDTEFQEIVDKLVYNSYGSWRTTQYDRFQRYSNGIEP